MSLRGRSRVARRLATSVDEERPRWLAVAAVAATVAVAVLALAAPRGSLTTPGPLSHPHTKANVGCAACHSAPSRGATALAPTENRGPAPAPETTTACLDCHGRHELRRGHRAAMASGRLGCATCHPAHDTETVTFLGEGRAIHAAPAGTREVAAPPVASGITVPIVRSGPCRACHDPGRATDPLAPCVDAASGLVVRCLNEHGDEARGSAVGGRERVACATSHAPGRFAAIDAALRVATASPLARLRRGPAGGAWLALLPIGVGLVAYATARARSRLKARVKAPPPPAPTTRRLPVIDASRCLGCYACVDACAFDVLAVDRYVATVARPDACCGALTCEAACPNGSLQMRDLGEAATKPLIGDDLEACGAPNVYLAGDLTGVPLIRNAALQGRQAIDTIRDRKRERRGDAATNQLDVLIVGAGPAGLAASLRAEQHGLSYATLEQGAVAASIKSFPRGKLVFDAPLDLPLEGELAVHECTKEELVAHWDRIVRTRKPRILEQHRVVELARTEHGYRVVYERADATRGQLEARAVVVAIGQRGSPRKLAAAIDAGAEAQIFDALYDARAFMGKRVLIVGLGDSAMEAVQALAHQPGTDLLVAHRGSSFGRGRAKNIEEVRGLVDAGRVAVRWETEVARVERAEGRGEALRVTLRHGGEDDIVEVDAILALLGGTPSLALLETLGLSTGGGA